MNPIVNPYFMQQLNVLLEHCSGVSIDSLVRSQVRNKQVGGAPKSSHLYGEAADLVFDETQQMLYAARRAVSMGTFTGIEVDMRNRHLHVDIMPRGEGVTWHVAYKQDGTLLPLRIFLQQSFSNAVSAN